MSLVKMSRKTTSEFSDLSPKTFQMTATPEFRATISGYYYTVPQKK